MRRPECRDGREVQKLPCLFYFQLLTKYSRRIGEILANKEINMKDETIIATTLMPIHASEISVRTFGQTILDGLAKCRGNVKQPQLSLEKDSNNYSLNISRYEESKT